MSIESVCPIVVVRVPALDLSTLRTSPFAEVLDADQALTQLMERLRAEGKSLAARLTDIVTSLDTADRRRVLALRRALYNTRHLSRGDIEVLKSAEEQLYRAVFAWSQKRLRGEIMRCQLFASWAECESRSAAELEALLGSGLFTSAVALSNPQTLISWQRHGARSRIADRTLWSLRWRATLRPTPLGLYASTGSGRWSPSGGVDVSFSERLVQAARSQHADEDGSHHVGFMRIGPRSSPPPATERAAFDSYCEGPQVSLGAWSSFLGDLAWYGARVQRTDPPPERAALSQLLRNRLSIASISLDSCASFLRAAAKSVGLHPMHAQRPSVVADAIGLSYSRDEQLIPTISLAQSLGTPICTSRGVPAGCQLGGRGTRAVFRWMPLAENSRGMQGRITFWGGSLMSFVARYVRGCPDRDALNVYRSWLRRWPSAVALDIEGAGPDSSQQLSDLTDRCLVQRPPTQDGELAASDVVIVASEADVRIVDRRTSREIEPVYFNMVGVPGLPDEFALLLNLGARRRTQVEALLTSHNRHLASEVLKLSTVAHYPPLWLTRNVQLAPELFVVPRAAVDVGLESGVSPSTFLDFHRWARRTGLPSGIVRLRSVTGGVDAQPVDLRHVHGVAALRRHLMKSGAVLVEAGDSVSANDDGCYLVEYATEVCG